MDSLPASGSPIPEELFDHIRALVETARVQVAQSVNSALVMLNWQIGHYINTSLKEGKRATYGEQVVGKLSERLTESYGKGYSRQNLFHMIRFAEVYSSEEIVSALSRQLSWSHFRELIYLKEDLQRDFYVEMCRLEKWSTRTLKERIASMLFERTAISRKPDELIRQELQQLKDSEKVSAELVFRDPYLLDFLGLKDTYSEKDLETAILRELEGFIIELGSDFAFVARQKRITIDNEDYYLDLLFYHRGLVCLVAVELKLGKFQAVDKGQMELYLRWLERYEKKGHENPPIGLILCADKSEQHVELLQLEKSNIRVAQYLTQLPDHKLLETKLRQAIAAAKARIDQPEQ